MITLYSNNWVPSETKELVFGGGEKHIQIKGLSNPSGGVILALNYEGDQDLMTLSMYVDALRRYGVNHIDLFVPYFPGARQDRVCNLGEALSVKVYADHINALNLNSVHIFDPHSDVTPALLNNVVVHKNHLFVQACLHKIMQREETNNKSDLIFVSPDAGANKKIYDLAKYIGDIAVIRADKLRDVSTGKIIETVIYSDDLTGKTAIIVDDIASYANTFKQLALKLKETNAKSIYLIVSHYEGVADQKSLKDSGIDYIYTTDSIPKWNKNGTDILDCTRVLALM